MRSFNPGEIPHHQLHRMLISIVAPRPIAFVSSIDADGRPNIAPFSCFNMFGVNPGTLIFSPSRSGRTNENKDTFLNIKEVPEVVINVVNYSMLHQMNLASTAFAHGVNEFYKSGLTPLASERVKPFRVKESPAQIECKVRQVIETGKGPGAANLVICEPLLIHVSDRVFNSEGKINPKKLDLIGRLGGDYYVRATGKALFELPQPRTAGAIGVDALSETIRMSNVLTGSDLAILGSLNQMPSAHEIERYAASAEFLQIIATMNENQAKSLTAIHHIARSLISSGDSAGALKILMAAERAIAFRDES